MTDDDTSRLRRIERELYTTDIQPPAKRGFLHDKKVDAPKDWGELEKKIETAKFAGSTSPGSLFKKIFLGSLAVFVLSLGFLGVSFLVGDNSISATNVDVVVTAKTFVDGGENLPVDVTVVNKNKLPLELATLVLEYPDGGSENAGTTARISRDIGSLGVGESRDETFAVQLYGPENSQKQITAHLEFRVSGSNAVYDKDEAANITIRTSPVQLTLDAPDKAIPNQEIPLKFTITGNGAATLPDTALVLQYPDGFTFTRAEPMPSYESNVFYLGDVPPGANRTITVYGTLSGSSQDIKTIRGAVGLQNKKSEQLLDTTYNSIAQVIPLTNAFLDAQITTIGRPGDTVPVAAGSEVKVSIPWRSTLAARLSNAEIHVHLSGSAFDPASVQPSGGFYDATNNEITWTRQQDPTLGDIDPGGSGSVDFSFVPKQTNGTVSIVNPAVNVSVDVQGIPAGGVRLAATGVAKKTFVVMSDLSLISKTIHYSGSIANTGPMPPTPGKETTYAVQWQITNSRNRVTGVSVSTILPINVKWKNVIVPATETANIVYNDVTRTLVWNVGEVPAGTGSTLPARTLSIKLGVTPSTTQRGGTIDLTNDLRLVGHDEFTKADISTTKHGSTTRVLNDTSTVGTDGIVR